MNSEDLDDRDGSLRDFRCEQAVLENQEENSQKKDHFYSKKICQEISSKPKIIKKSKLLS